MPIRFGGVPDRRRHAADRRAERRHEHQTQREPPHPAARALVRRRQPHQVADQRESDRKHHRGRGGVADPHRDCRANAAVDQQDAPRAPARRIATTTRYRRCAGPRRGRTSLRRG